MTTIDRIYTGKDVEMLIASHILVESALANKVFLISKRSTWVDPFFTNLTLRIDAAVKTYLGVDGAKKLREATQTVNGIQAQAISDLAELKVQVEEDFKKNQARRDEILKQLGFVSHHATARKGDQEGMIELLYQLKTNMSDSLKTEIVAKGTDAALITRIMGYADSLLQANVLQETFKGDRKDATGKAVTEFNEIYSEVISICRISTNFFKDKPTLKALFNYSKTIKQLNNEKKSPTPPTIPPAN